VFFSENEKWSLLKIVHKQNCNRTLPTQMTCVYICIESMRSRFEKGLKLKLLL